MTPLSVLGLINIIVTYTQVTYTQVETSESSAQALRFPLRNIGLIRVTYDPPVIIRVNKYLK